MYHRWEMVREVMNTPSSPQKALHGFVLLALFLSLFFAGGTPPARAQDPGLEAAILAALKAHRENSTVEYYYNLLSVVEYGDRGVGQADKIRKGTGEVLPGDFSIILGEKDQDGNWRVALPDEEGAYLDLLEAVPDRLLGIASREHIREAYGPAAQSIYADHYLPWIKDAAALVYQNYTAHGEGQLDFGFPGDIRTSKTGTLIFAYDAHTWSKCAGQPFTWCSSNYPKAWYYNNAVVIKHTDGEYSSYLHLQTDSIPAGVINNCNSGNGGSCTPVNIPAGTVIGTVGSTGYSTGAHLHFGTGDYVYGRCDYPDVYDEDEDGNTAETNICTGGINYGHDVSTSFHEKPYDAPNCGTGAGQDPTLCMLHYPKNTNLVSQNPTGYFKTEFNDPALEPGWHWIREDPSHWSLTASPGFLRILTQSKDIRGGNNNTPLLLHPLAPSLSEDFQIQTRILIAPDADHQQGGLVIYQDDDNYVTLTHAYTDGLKFEFARETGADFQPVQFPAPPGVNDFHLRITKLGLNYYAHFSQDGAAWTWLGGLQNVNLSPLEVGVLAFNAAGSASAEIPADFDAFRLDPAVPLTISGDAGAGGVTLSYVDGISRSVTSAADGSYSLPVPPGWSGTVTPSKAGYTFNPVRRTYTTLVSDRTSQNYKAITSLVLTSRSSQDGWTIESGENSGRGGAMNAAATYVVVGDNGRDRQYRAIVSFNTSGLPDTAVITAATLKLGMAGVSGTDPFTTHGDLLVDLRKGPFSDSLALQPEDFQAPAGLEAAMTILNNPVNGWYSRSIPKAAFSQIHKGGITQFRLRFALDDNDDLGADYLKFHSGDTVSVSLRPQLIIKYYVP